MRVDRATTGPKFIQALEADGLIRIDRYPKIDKRKDFLSPTKKLERLVEGELRRVARSLSHFADVLQGLVIAHSIDVDEATRVPLGGPSSDKLLPVDWPPDDVGISFKTELRSRQG